MRFDCAQGGSKMALFGPLWAQDFSMLYTIHKCYARLFGFLAWQMVKKAPPGAFLRHDFPARNEAAQSIFKNPFV